MNKKYLTYENKILGQEVERLAKEVERLEKVNQMLLNSIVTEAPTKETKEIERLNNIINEFDKLIENEINESKLEDDYERVDSLEYCLATLKELKGSNGAIPPEVIGTNGEDGGMFDYGDR